MSRVGKYLGKINMEESKMGSNLERTSPGKSQA